MLDTVGYRARDPVGSIGPNLPHGDAARAGATTQAGSGWLIGLVGLGSLAAAMTCYLARQQ